MRRSIGLPKKVIACALAALLGVSGVHVPDVAWAQEEQAIPEWAVDDGRSEHPEEEPSGIGVQAALPAAYDMRNDGVVTPVKSQGHMMSCWTFGGIAAAETSILSANTTAFGTNNNLDLSERHLAFFSLNPVSEADDKAQAGEGMHTFATNPNAAFDAGGDSMFVTSLFSTGVGPVVEQAFPYRGVDANGVSHTNLQIFDADPYAGTMKWVREQLQANGITDDPETHYQKTEAEIVEHFKEDARKAALSNIYYSPEEDWSIPLTSEDGMSNRCLQSGVLLKDGNILPSYWNENDADHNAPSTDAMNAMKQEMLDGHGVSLAFCASRDPDESVTDEGGMRYKQYVPTLKGRDHGVCVVGWDDNYAASNFKQTPPGNGAWIVKNSWGSTADACEDDLGNVVNNVEYGYKNDEGKYTGYFYLSYFDKTIDKLETMDFTDTLGSEERGLAVAQHDYMPACNGFYATAPSNAVVSSANVFDAEENFEIRGLSTFTGEPNTRVTFAVYELNDGAANPTDGKLLYRTSQNFGYEGYHRLDLTQRPVVAKGKKFSVVSTVSTLTTDGKRAYQVAANRGISEASAKEREFPFYATARVNPGESYISVGSGWQDWTNYKSENNVESDGPVDNFSIKAYGAVVDIPEPQPEPQPEPTTFPDVAEDAWYHDSVTRAVDLGLFHGFEDGSFGPEQNISRGDIAVVLWNMAGSPEPGEGAKKFDDVDAQQYYATAIAWASGAGIVGGYPGGNNFGPDDPIRREEFATMMAGFAKLKGQDTTGSADDYKDMKDAASVSKWAESSVGWCFTNKIMSGQGENINPQGNATRAEAAKMTVILHDMLFVA